MRFRELTTESTGLSPETLASYKKKASAEASALDKEAWEQGGPNAQKKIAKANKRFSGIVRATKKEFDNDAKSVVEGTRNIGKAIKSLYRKIYIAGDDEIDYFYNDSPIFAQYWDEYEGDLDSIIAEVDPSELQVILDELESYAQQAGLAESEKSPMFKDSQKQDRIRSLKNLIAIAKEQGRQLRVQELELELKKLQGVVEDSITESSTIDFIRGLISEFNTQISGSPYYPMDYKNPGMRMWTRGDGSRYKDPGYIFIDRDLKPEDQPKWHKAKAVEKFWQFLASKGARKIGDVSGEFGSDPHSPAVVLNKQVFVFNGRNIAWGSTSRLKNSSVWRQKQQSVAEGFDDIVKGVKRVVKGKEDPKEVEHTYGRIARSAIKHKTPDQAEKDIKRWERVNRVVNKEEVEEGAEERSQNRLWQMITDYEKRAKATKSDIKRDHYIKMAQQLRDKLKTNEQVKESPETVAFEVDSENAYNHIMHRYGSRISWDGDAMVIPAKYWNEVQELALSTGGNAVEYGTTNEASLATMRDYFAGDKNAEDELKITQQRKHYANDHGKQQAPKFNSLASYHQWLKRVGAEQINKK